MKISARKILNAVATTAVVALTAHRINMIATGKDNAESTLALSYRITAMGFSVLALTATNDSMSKGQKKVLYAGCAALGALSLVTLVLKTETTVVYEWTGEPIIIGGKATM